MQFKLKFRAIYEGNGQGLVTESYSKNRKTTTTGDRNPPSCFISYTWEDSEHEAWVLNLATKLVENGIRVVLDKWDLRYGHDLPHFMETSVRESDHVILVCTPTYARKADEGRGGAGYEKRIVTGEMFHGSDESKFIPLIRKGSDDETLPSFLKSKNYIDFRKNTQFYSRLRDLLHQLHGIQKYPRPKLGLSPFKPSAQPPSVGTRSMQRLTELPPPLDIAFALPRRQQALAEEQKVDLGFRVLLAVYEILWDWPHGFWIRTIIPREQILDKLGGSVSVIQVERAARNLDQKGWLEVEWTHGHFVASLTAKGVDELEARKLIPPDKLAKEKEARIDILRVLNESYSEDPKRMVHHLDLENRTELENNMFCRILWYLREKGLLEASRSRGIFSRGSIFSARITPSGIDYVSKNRPASYS